MRVFFYVNRCEKVKITGAQALMEALVREEVNLMFGYPGGAIMPTYDALYDYQDKIKHVLVRHEQGAAISAIGYSRATGNVGVALATSGPGATNLITGIADALLDSVPIVCITGQVAAPLLGTDAFQESDIVGMTVPVTKWNYQITDASEIPEVVSKAFAVARHGKPGPVLIDITKDAQVQEFEYPALNDWPVFEMHNRYRGELSKANLQRAADLINEATQPLIFVGHGVLLSKAEEELIALSEKANIPVCSTLLGLSAFPSGHDNFKGMLGMHGNYGPNILSNKADVVIAVGMRFDDRVTGKLSTFLNDAKVIHIEIDQAELGKNIDPAVGLLADAKEGLQALLPLVEENKHPEWHQRFTDCYAEEMDKVIKQEILPTEGQIKMAEVIHMLSEKTQGQAIIVSDVGQHQMMAARYYGFERPDSHISSGGLGTMGFSLPAAIGAKFGQPEREVIVIVGDGGIQMNIQELAVAMQENIAVKVVILNNSFLGMVRQWQELFFEKRYSFTEMDNPDFVKVAEAYRIKGEKVEEREKLSAALDAMLATDKPYLLDIHVEKQDNVFPMVPAGAGVDDVRLS